MVAHLERYRAEMDAPVLEGVEVQALEPRGEGFELSTSVGPMSARSVVVCTGAYQRALSPPGTDGLPAHVTMLDTRAYRNPAMVPDGDVLVVGSGQSGCQIAEDLVDSGRSVILSCGRAPWVPRRIGDHDVFWWVLETGFMSERVETLPTPAARLAANLTARRPPRHGRSAAITRHLATDGPAHRDRTVQDPRPSTSASPPK